MKYKLLLLALFCVLPVIALADGTDSALNYVAGTNAGAGLETDATGSRAYNNTAVGAYALQQDSTGSANTAIGYMAASRLTSGIGNVVLGFLAGDSLTASSHQLVIGNGFYPAYGIFGILSSGYFGINTASPNRALYVSGSAYADSVITPVLSVTTSMAGVNQTLTGRLTASSADIDSIYRGLGGQVILNDSISVTGLVSGVNATLTGRLTASSADVDTLYRGLGGQVIMNDSLQVNSLLTAGASVNVTGDLTVTSDVNADTIQAQGDAQITMKADVVIDSTLVVTGTVSGLYNVHLNLDADSVMTTANFKPGALISSRTVTAKRTYTLPAAAAGLAYEFQIVDTDSCIVKSATGDSLADGTSVVMNMSTVNGTAKFIAIDGTYWAVLSKAGSWVNF